MQRTIAFTHAFSKLNTMQEKVIEMQARIDELNLNMPKKVAKKMELAAKRAADLELMAEAQQADKNANKCVIS